MRKTFVSFLLIGLSSVFAIFYLHFDSIVDPRYVSDLFFIVGIVFFFFGLLAATDATKVLRGAGYTLKQMFFTKTRTNVSFYEYSQAKKEQDYSAFGLSLIFIGILFIGLAILSAEFLGQFI